MHLKNLFKAFAIGALISSCAALPKPPDVDLCTMIYDKAGNYFYCEPYFYEGRNGYEIHSDTAAQAKYFAVSPQHFADIKKYVYRLEQEAKRRCQ